MNWDSIGSIITTASTAIVAVCSVMALRTKKHPADMTRLFQRAIVLVVVAAVALVLGVISHSMTTLSAMIVAVCSTLLFLKINKYSTTQEGAERKSRMIIVTSVLVLSTTGIMLLILNSLPAILGEVVKEQCDIIASDTKLAILKDIREGHEKVAATLADSMAACRVLYREALEQARAGEFNYVDRIDGRYFVCENWKENREPILLTAEEISIIQDCFAASEAKEDLCVLIYSVLRDERMITELAQPGAYDVEYDELDRIGDPNISADAGEKTKRLGGVSVVTRKTVRHLTPYQKIGVIGAYIDEIRNNPAHDETSL